MSERTDASKAVGKLIKMLDKPPKIKPDVLELMDVFKNIYESDTKNLKELKIQIGYHINYIERVLDGEEKLSLDNSFGYTDERGASLILRKLNKILNNASTFIKYRDEINADSDKISIIEILKELQINIDKL